MGKDSEIYAFLAPFQRGRISNSVNVWFLPSHLPKRRPVSGKDGKETGDRNSPLGMTVFIVKGGKEEGKDRFLWVSCFSISQFLLPKKRGSRKTNLA